MTERTGLKTTFSWAGTTIAQVASIGPPGPKRDTVEVEDLNPVNQIKKKLLGLIDVGECTLTLNFDKAATGHSTLEAALWSGTSGACVITLPDSGGTCSFSGYVTGFAPSDITADAVLQAEVTIMVTTKPTWA